MTRNHRLGFVLSAGLALLLAAAQAEGGERAIGPITGVGTVTTSSSRIPRFTAANRIGDSVMQQSRGGNIGINRFPLAVLHVNKAQPATLPRKGWDATTLLLTSGGKGGATSAIGATAGNGANISLVAGNGGDAVSGAVNGDGGKITLQPGNGGTGGSGGKTGDVLLAPVSGNVGIGTDSPQRALQIGADTNSLFTLSPTDGSPRAGFIRFGDNTGWSLIIGRNREFGGGPLNTGFSGSLFSIRDNGAIFQSGGYPFGPTGVGHLCRTLANAITMCSSSAAVQRFRTGVAPFEKGLDLVRRLQPLAYTRTDTGDRTIGLAAEQVAAIEPRLVSVNGEGEVESVNYDLLTVALAGAIQEQQRQLREQQALIETLRTRLDRLETRMTPGQTAKLQN